MEEAKKLEKNILSPILELSDGDYSAALEQLSEYTGDVTDRNIEDILQEAEDLIQSSKDSSLKEGNHISPDYTELINEIKKNRKKEPKDREDTKLQKQGSSPEMSKMKTKTIVTESANHIKFTLDSLNDKITDHFGGKISRESPRPDRENNKLMMKSSVEVSDRPRSAAGRRRELPKSHPVACNYTASADVGVIDKADYELLQDVVSVRSKSLTPESSVVLDQSPRKTSEKSRTGKLETSLNSTHSLQSQRWTDNETNELDTLRHEIVTQESLIQGYQIENTKLCFAVKEANEKLKQAGAKSAVVERPKNDELFDQLKDKDELIVKLEMELDEFRSRRSCGDDDARLASLEHQFELLKSKYEDKINKLEIKNKQLSRPSLAQVINVEPSRLTQQSSASVSSQTSTESPPDDLPAARNSVPARPKLIKPTIKRPLTKPSVKKQTESKSNTIETQTSARNVNVESQTDRTKSDTSVQTWTDTTITKEVQTETENKTSVSYEVSVQTCELPVVNYTEEEVVEKKKEVNKKFKKADESNKKTSEHEIHLMATLRGTQSELEQKDKENKKLKVELESTRSQIKKLQNFNKCFDNNNKKKLVEVVKKCTIGCQTVGLELNVPYDASLFQVSDDVENENKDLRKKCEELEQELRKLELKRTSDLQLLQELHEEEMKKLDSQLETRTALVKHLHQLYVKR